MSQDPDSREVPLTNSAAKGEPCLLALGLSIMLGTLMGCASQGQPQPPSLHLPGLATALVAERVGDQVALTWTTPATTTDGERIRGTMTAAICVDTAAPFVPSVAAPSGSLNGLTGRAKKKPTPHPPAATGNPSFSSFGSPNPTCAVLQRLTVTPGPGRATVDLPVGVVHGGAVLLGFHVELANAAARSAGLSDAAYVAGGQAPDPAGPITIEAVREGALLHWNRSKSMSTMELKRTQASVAAAPVTAERAATKRAIGLGGNAPPAREVTLRPETTAGFSVDPGGILDRTVRDQSTYVYTAQRVEGVTLSGQTFTLRGVPSPPVTFTFRDVFPPRPPLGLVSIPGGGFGAPASIDLTWEVSPEDDVVGYQVYRSDDGKGLIRQNAAILQSPAFRDLHVEPGHTYLYRVTAVDGRRNESEPSKSIQETLRK